MRDSLSSQRWPRYPFVHRQMYLRACSSHSPPCWHGRLRQATARTATHRQMYLRACSSHSPPCWHGRLRQATARTATHRQMYLRACSSHCPPCWHGRLRQATARTATHRQMYLRACSSHSPHGRLRQATARTATHRQMYLRACSSHSPPCWHGRLRQATARTATHRQMYLRACSSHCPPCWHGRLRQATARTATHGNNGGEHRNLATGSRVMRLIAWQTGNSFIGDRRRQVGMTLHYSLIVRLFEISLRHRATMERPDEAANLAVCYLINISHNRPRQVIHVMSHDYMRHPIQPSIKLDTS